MPEVRLRSSTCFFELSQPWCAPVTLRMHPCTAYVNPHFHIHDSHVLCLCTCSLSWCSDNLYGLAGSISLGMHTYFHIS